MRVLPAAGKLASPPSGLDRAGFLSHRAHALQYALPSPLERAMHKIVFLDRDSLLAEVRRPAFDHDWLDYPATAPDQVLERLRGATIAVTNKVPLRQDVIGQ